MPALHSLGQSSLSLLLVCLCLSCRKVVDSPTSPYLSFISDVHFVGFPGFNAFSGVGEIQARNSLLRIQYPEDSERKVCECWLADSMTQRIAADVEVYFDADGMFNFHWLGPTVRRDYTYIYYGKVSEGMQLRTGRESEDYPSEYENCFIMVIRKERTYAVEMYITDGVCTADGLHPLAWLQLAGWMGSSRVRHR